MSVLCDWLSIYQEHSGVELPRINNGAVFCVNADGAIEWTTEARFEHVGSFDTKIRIKCDGFRVTFDGNVGRFGRPDNVFGYSVSQCVLLANKILAGFGLPPFTAQKFDPNRGKKRGGAVITRVDLTQNYMTGCPKKATRLVHYLGGQDAGRRATVKQYGDNGVTWNEGSKYQSSKLYIKAESLGIHVTEAVADWVKQIGLVRHEISLKSRYLERKNLQDIGAWQVMEKGRVKDMDNVIYGQFTEVLTRGEAVRDQLEDIPGRVGALAMAWRAGRDLWGDTSVTRQTRARWRKELLRFGIDIKQPSNITRLSTRVEVISLSPVQAPSWYWDQQNMAMEEVRAA